MATGLERNKHRNRPRKSPAERRRRNKMHRKRVVAMGVPAEKAEKMDTKVLRALIRKPVKTAKTYAATKKA